jgi:predicted CopG family antitoxin
MYTYIVVVMHPLVRVISISDEVYAELSRMKNGKSFTELLKTLISECANKGDAKSIIAFLETKGPISEESAKNITESSEKGRKSTTARKPASFE